MGNRPGCIRLLVSQSLTTQLLVPYFAQIFKNFILIRDWFFGIGFLECSRLADLDFAFGALGPCLQRAQGLGFCNEDFGLRVES